MKALVACLGLVCLTLSLSVQGHIASNGFLVAEVQDTRLQGSIELAVRDLEVAVGVDANHDGKITWGEVRASASALRQYVAAHLQFAAQNSTCTLAFGNLQVNDRVDGSYIWLPWSARCATPVRELRVDYKLLRDVDPSHRGLLTLRAGATAQTAVLGGASSSLDFDVTHASVLRTFTEYLCAGVWHILSGIDHLLFLASLLLPVVLLRDGGRWVPVESVRPAFVNILKIVTSFTIAHSVTLALAAFGIIRLPTRLTESVIAASIIVAALNNLFPVTQRRSRMAFLFGLLHGFGFASVLADMGLPQGARLLSLLAFNLGIECGQLALVLLIMPVAYAVRHAAIYERLVLPVGSAGVAGLAGVWLVQRAFGV